MSAHPSSPEPAPPQPAGRQRAPRGAGAPGLPHRERLRWGLAAAASALVLAGCSTSAALSATRHRSTPTPTPTTATTTTAAPVAVCPLTGVPAPGGVVPLRPALAVKVDNYPSARPQAGLNYADIVYEEPVEGGITRYVAVFQCQQAPLVGPVRSARNIDVGILRQFGAPLLAHVGGIDPVIADIDASPIVDLDLGTHTSVIQHPAGRDAPYDTYTTTAALWGLRATDRTPPAPVFTYSSAVPAGAPAGSVAIPFSGTSDVVWHYDRAITAYQRDYGTAPDAVAGGGQNAAVNVVVQFVDVTDGPWLENEEGGLEVQANLSSTASGAAEVFRNGVEITGTWTGDSPSQPTRFLNAQGQPIPLQPGPTWVELVPSTVSVGVSP